MPQRFLFAVEWYRITLNGFAGDPRRFEICVPTSRAKFARTEGQEIVYTLPVLDDLLDYMNSNSTCL